MNYNYWYDWSSIPPLLRPFLSKKGTLIVNNKNKYVANLIESTLMGRINYPEFFPNWRVPKMSDIPNFVSVQETLNERAHVWNYQVNVTNDPNFFGTSELSHHPAYLKRFLWCARNCEDFWHGEGFANCYFLFKSPHDAMTFKMLWRTWPMPEMPRVVSQDKNSHMVLT